MTAGSMVCSRADDIGVRRIKIRRTRLHEKVAVSVLRHRKLLDLDALIQPFCDLLDIVNKFIG